MANKSYILEMTSFCATSGNAESEHKIDVYPTLEKAQKAMKRKAANRLKQLPGWEKVLENGTKIRLECESMFFDKNVTYKIYGAEQH